MDKHGLATHFKLATTGLTNTHSYRNPLLLVNARMFVPAVQELVGGLLPDICAANKHARRILLFGSSTVRDRERGISLQIPPVCLPFILTKEILANSVRHVEVLRTSIAFLEEFSCLMAELEAQGREASYDDLPLGACTAFQNAAQRLAWQVPPFYS